MFFGIIMYAAFGLLVKGSRRRPLTAKTGVRFPHKLLLGPGLRIRSHCFIRAHAKGGIGMKRSIRTVLFVGFVFAMLLVLASCGKKDDTKNETVTPTAAPTETPTPTEVPATPTPTPNPLDEMTLKDLYKDDFKIGVAIPNSLYASKAVTEEIAANFNSMTFENESKPDQILDIKGCQSGLPDTYTEPKVKFDSIKRGMEYAKENGIAVRFHTLLWYQQTPEGFFTEDYQKGSPKVSREVMLKRMESYIRQVMTYMEETYPGMVYCYDVVNEAVNPGEGDPNGLRAKSFWYEVVGPDFMNYAFEYARKYAPEGVDLYYNDYNCYSKSNQILKVLEPILAAGNIDGIGMQCHLSTSTSVAREVIGTAKTFTKAGFKVQITELDIGTTNTDNGFEIQAMKYKVLFQGVQKGKRDGSIDIDCITVWGIHDSVSWRGDEYPLLYKWNGYKMTKKKAWYGAMQDPAIRAMEF